MLLPKSRARVARARETLKPEPHLKPWKPQKTSLVLRRIPRILRYHSGSDSEGLSPQFVQFRVLRVCFVV